ncbi:MAG: hypothetical protein JRJ42_09590 [Deltaproteobacteria bacterium]|nr:hypothetical protein [Deltaproteobacteria bacterium]MBW2020808.1 hypothetical protein [Deltaproteobacteria bacterium]MBW2075411.1 hypothetical protein [Deltaproteobacteria bacterium]
MGRFQCLLVLATTCIWMLFPGCVTPPKADRPATISESQKTTRATQGYQERLTQGQPRFFLPVYDQIIPFIDRGDYAGALSVLQEGEAQFGEKDRLLYLMESGLMNLYNHDYASCRNILTEAESLDEELYTMSITRQATTFVINDLIAPYRGEDYESVMLNLLLALAYLQEGSVEDALVEARKVDKKLEAINSQYPEDKKNAYKEDAFVRWLMGMLYEMDPTSANLNDAFVSYRKALDVYEKDYLNNYGIGPPVLLKQNYLSLAEWIGGSEFDEAKRRFDGVPFLSQKDKKRISTLTFIHFNGKSPIKVERSITSPLPDGHIIKIAFPKYQDRPFTIVDSEMCATKVNDRRTFRARSHLGEPIAKIAHSNLENRKVRMLAKATARAAAKYAGTKLMEERAEERFGLLGGLMAKVLGNAFIVLSEKADLRFWQSLPGEIRVAQLHVPPGTYLLEAHCLTGNGEDIEKLRLGTVTTKPGENRVFIFRTIK